MAKEVEEAVERRQQRRERRDDGLDVDDEC